MLNSLLLTAASEVIRLGEGEPNRHTLDFHFMSSKEGSKFSYYPAFVEKVTIDKNYAENFADVMFVDIMASPHDVALMQDQGQDLICLMTMMHFDKHLRPSYDHNPYQKQYHALLCLTEDIRKSLPDAHAYREPTVNLRIQLIEPEIYEIRNTKINAIFQSMNVEKAILACTKLLGIDKINLHKVDNTTVFDHIPIVSQQGIDSVYVYLQSLCGIYSKGIGAYYDKDCLFVYPALDTKISHAKSTLIYLVDQGRYGGSDRYHCLEGNVTSIVVNSRPRSYDFSIVGSENEQTGYIFNRASRLGDGMTSVSKSGSVGFVEDTSIRLSLEKNRSLISGRNNDQHVMATDNPYPLMSKLIYKQASLMELEWPCADPTLLDPCEAMTFYFDRNGEMIQKTGILERATYEFIKGPKSGPKYTFGIFGKLTLRLSPEEIVV